MVGVGIDGVESSLARVSLVNFYGAIQLDEFVRQRERVVDYRTQFSGIRESDMIKGMESAPCIISPSDPFQTAKPFDIVQKQVAELLQDRILIGHAVYNDLKVSTLEQVPSHTPACVLVFLIKRTGTPTVPSASTNTRYSILRWKI
jgi:RNA exonuclease 4